MPPNVYIGYLATSLAVNGSETEAFLTTIQTLTGETLTTAQFATLGRGILTIDPLSSANVEFISFTGVDAVSVGVTGVLRGLSALSNIQITANKKYHPAGTQVIIAFGIHDMLDFKTYIDNAVAGIGGTATDTNAGVAFITENLGTRPRAMAALVSQQASPNMTLKVNPFDINSIDQVVSYAGANTATLVAPVSNPRIDLIVYNTVSATLIVRAGAEAGSPSVATVQNGDIALAEIYHRVGETKLLERDDSTNGYIRRWYLPAVYNANVIPAGVIDFYAGYTSPTAWLKCDGSPVSRTGNANLFSAICPSGTFTVTLATPGVFTKTAHGYLAGDRIHFTTTGALPTGLLTGTEYYVISTGLTTNAFEVSLSPSGPAINTSGSQSGIHTVYLSPYGIGDGSTTFNVPNLQGRTPLGIGASTQTLLVDSSNLTLASPGVWTIPADSELSQGQAVTLTTTGALPTGYAISTTYYVIRASQTATSIELASTRANANAGTGINTSGSQSGVHSIIYTMTSNRTVIGRKGGEEIHGISITELAAHVHPGVAVQSGTASSSGGTVNGAANTSSGSTGGDAPHNNMSPFLTGIWIIKT